MKGGRGERGERMRPVGGASPRARAGWSVGSSPNALTGSPFLHRLPPGRSVRERRKPKLRRALWSGWSGWSSGNGRRPAVGLVACPRRPCCPQGCRRRHRGPAEGGPMVPILLWDHWDHWDGGSSLYVQRVRRSSVTGWRRKRYRLATKALQAGDESVAGWRTGSCAGPVVLAGRPPGRVRLDVRRARQQPHGFQLPAAAHVSVALLEVQQSVIA